MTLVIEVKGCWNRELRSAMRTQLADRYLSASRRYGIYLPVWFGPAHWDGSTDGRHAACARIDRGRLAAELRRQADALRGEGYCIAPVTLDASLAG